MSQTKSLPVTTEPNVLAEMDKAFEKNLGRAITSRSQQDGLQDFKIDHQILVMSELTTYAKSQLINFTQGHYPLGVSRQMSKLHLLLDVLGIKFEDLYSVPSKPRRPVSELPPISCPYPECGKGPSTP